MGQFTHNGTSVRFLPAAQPRNSLGPSLSTRLPSQLFLFSNFNDAEQLLQTAASPTPGLPQQLISRPSVGGLCPLVVAVIEAEMLESHATEQLLQIGNRLADTLGGILKVLPCQKTTASEAFIDQEEAETFAFNPEHVEILLHELCALQLDSGHSDLRVRVSAMCGDPHSLEPLLAPLLEQCNLPVDASNRKFWLDVNLPPESDEFNGSMNGNGLVGSTQSIGTGSSPSSHSPSASLCARRLLQDGSRARVCLSVGSFHHWLLAKWPLQSVQGHLLVFSPHRRASWRQARCAAKLLLDAVGSPAMDEENDAEEEDAERRAMGRSIFLLALNEPNAFFTDKVGI